MVGDDMLINQLIEDEENQDIKYEVDTEDRVEEILENQDKGRKYNLKSFIFDIIIYAIILFISLKIIPTYVIQRTIVDGPSMMDTLHDGESLIVEKVSYHFTGAKRYDIVIFYPYGSEYDEFYVKRVIGLPNETVQIINDDIYINGELIEEKFGKEPMDYAGIAKEPITLGDDEYFVLGDNRNHSLDSRYDSLGPVPKENIVGKAVLRVWPLSEFGLLK